MRDVTIPLNALTAFIAFLLTHPVWDVTNSFVLNFLTCGFLLTHPVWDVTDVSIFSKTLSVISTHTSRVGCDMLLGHLFRDWQDFYSHIPCGM